MEKRKHEALEALDGEKFELAIQLMIPLAEAGDTEIQSDLGTLYQLGLGTSRDLEKAVYWLEKAASSGFGLAAHNLGTLYMTCLPDWPLDPEKSERWRARAQELGYSPFEGKRGRLG